MNEIFMAVLSIPPIALGVLLYFVPRTSGETQHLLMLAAMPALAFTAFEIAIGLFYLANLIVTYSMGV